MPLTGTDTVAPVTAETICWLAFVSPSPSCQCLAARHTVGTAGDQVRRAVSAPDKRRHPGGDGYTRS
jgi:hypothetical protein